MQDSVLPVALGLAVICVGRSDGGSEDDAERLPITSGNAQEVASTIWLDNTATRPEDVLEEGGVLLYELLPLVAIHPEGVEVPCKTSGKIVVHGEVADAARPGRTAGDSVTADYQDCTSGAPGGLSEILDGVIQLEVLGVTPIGVGTSVTYEGFTMSVPGLTSFEITGERLVSVLEDVYATRVTAYSAKLTVTGEGLTEAVEDHLVTLVASADDLDAPFALSFRGTLVSERLGGVLDFETTTRFEGVGDHYPDVGELRIEGGLGTSVTLVAVDGARVKLEIDEDGDGRTDDDKSLELDWESLEGFEPRGPS